jgi:hypothetical protein
MNVPGHLSILLRVMFSSFQSNFSINLQSEKSLVYDSSWATEGGKPTET